MCAGRSGRICIYIYEYILNEVNNSNSKSSKSSTDVTDVTYLSMFTIKDIILEISHLLKHVGESLRLPTPK